MRLEFRPEKSHDASLSKPALDPVRSKTPRPSEAPSAKVDSHELATGDAEPRRYQEGDESLSPRAKVHTDDDFVDLEVRASRARSAESDEATSDAMLAVDGDDADEEQLDDAESEVDGEISKAVSQRNVARVNELEQKKAEIDDEELALAEAKQKRQEEAKFKKDQAQIEKARVRELCDRARFANVEKKKLAEQRSSQQHQRNAKDALQVDRHLQLAAILAERRARFCGQPLFPGASFRPVLPTQRGMPSFG